MEIVRLGLLLLHLVGYSVLLGGQISQASQHTKRVTGLVRGSAGLAVSQEPRCALVDRGSRPD